MKKKRIALCICLYMFMLNMSATNANSNSTLCEIQADTTLNTVHISSGASMSGVDLFRGTYKGNKLINIQKQNISLVEGTANTFVFDEDIAGADTVKYFCWKKNLEPCSNVMTRYPYDVHTVSFLNWDGQTLTTQNVQESGTAILPSSPSRSGYIFAGWDKDYKNITESTILTARYVFSEADNIFRVSSATGNVGDEITVTVSLVGTVKLCAFDMKLFYDDRALEYVRHGVGSALDVNAGYNPEGDFVSFNFSSNKNRTKSADIMTVTFKIKEGALTGTILKLTPIEVLATDSNSEVGFIIPEQTPRADVGVNFIEGVVFGG